MLPVFGGLLAHNQLVEPQERCILQGDKHAIQSVALGLGKTGNSPLLGIYANGQE